MVRDRQDPYGITFRGPDTGLTFLRPYRRTGVLNEQELWKLERHPLDVAEAVVNRYAQAGPASLKEIPGEVERLKWVGIYPQRQGGDAFMLRIKVPGGCLDAAQAREIGAIAATYAEGPEAGAVFGNHFLDLTTRQDIQVHWLRLADIPRIWQRLHDVGVTTVQACGDTARNVTCCPLAGVDAEEAFDALPVARAISAFFTGNREYANLPRKFKVAVTGCLEDCARIEINDVGLWPARAADGALGFNLLVGGGLSDGERLASDVDVFVAPKDAVEITRGIAQLFGELGNRENRGQARLRYLVQELGPEGFRAELARRVSVPLPVAGKDLTTAFRGDHVGVRRQRQAGLSSVGCCVPVGRMAGLDLVEAARLAEAYGDGSIRLGTDQNFILTGVPDRRVEQLLAEPLLAAYSPDPGPFTRGVVACTGSEFCRFAVVETKARAVEWARRLDSEVAHRRAPSDQAGAGAPEVVRMHFSGCSASCAQPQIADIGFRGGVAHRGEELVEAVDIGMGGSLGTDAGFIDWVAGAVPVDEVPDALGRVLRRFGVERRPEEQFHAWARRTPNGELLRSVRGTDDGTIGGVHSGAALETGGRQ